MGCGSGMGLLWGLVGGYEKKEKMKKKEDYLYSVFIQRLVSKRSDMDHTVLPANYTRPAFLS